MSVWVSTRRRGSGRERGSKGGDADDGADADEREPDRVGDEAEASGGRGLDADRLFAGVDVGVRTVADFVLGLLLCMSCAWRRADARARIGVCCM